MNVAIAMTLEDAIRQAGEGWLIDAFPPAAEGMEAIRRNLAAVHRQAQQRMGANAPDFSEQPLSRNFGATVHRCEGFFRRLVEDAHRICF